MKVRFQQSFSPVYDFAIIVKRKISQNLKDVEVSMIQVDVVPVPILKVFARSFIWTNSRVTIVSHHAVVVEIFFIGVNLLFNHISLLISLGAHFFKQSFFSFAVLVVFIM